MSRAEPMVVLSGITKSFGKTRAVDDVSLEIGAGEFFSLLGPSGCGKTTTLRIVAGFEEPTAGRVLLDEPLGALDLKLRKEMQLELKAIQEDTGTTFIYVTHDQEEALTMSDRIAVMSGGVVEQIDEPRVVYERPATAFVADFIGTSNTLTLRVDRREAGCVVMDLGEGSRLVAPDPGGSKAILQITVRPEKVRLSTDVPNGGASCVRGEISKHVYMGSMTQLIIELETGEQLTVHRLNDDRAQAELPPGSSVWLEWLANNSFVIGSEAPTARSPLASTTEGTLMPEEVGKT